MPLFVLLVQLIAFGRLSRDFLSCQLEECEINHSNFAKRAWNLLFVHLFIVFLHFLKHR